MQASNGIDLPFISLPAGNQGKLDTVTVKGNDLAMCEIKI